MPAGRQRPWPARHDPRRRSRDRGLSAGRYRNHDPLALFARVGAEPNELIDDHLAHVELRPVKRAGPAPLRGRAKQTSWTMSSPLDTSPASTAANRRIDGPCRAANSSKVTAPPFGWFTS